MSLLMEHMIGLTDTAYLGRVGEVELGASALAGVYYLDLYAWLRFQYRRAGIDSSAKRRTRI